MCAANKKTVLHIHQDYPDSRPYPSTKAVYNLIRSTENFDPKIKHIVLSINRTSNPLRISLKKFEQGYTLVYWCFPIEFLYLPMIYMWSLLLSFFFRRHEFNIIHAHKLTTESLFAYFLSKKLNVNFISSVRGGSDCNNLVKYRRSTRRIFKKVYHKAMAILWVSPWAKSMINHYLAVDECKPEIDFPNICRIEEISAEFNPANKDGITTIVSFHQYKRKGLLTLIEALYILDKKGISVKLNIIGSGPNHIVQHISELIKEKGLSKQIKLLGQLSNDDVVNHLKSSSIFALPAINETFGMSYIEAVACGTPFIQMANTGPDGFFELNDTSIKLSKQCPYECAAAIQQLLTNKNTYLEQVKEYHNSGELNKFTTNNISKSYSELIHAYT